MFIFDSGYITTVNDDDSNNISAERMDQSNNHSDIENNERRSGIRNAQNAPCKIRFVSKRFLYM